MKDKLVTLIGGGGFAGRYIAQDLLNAGARVRIAERDPRDAWFIKPLGGLGQTQFVGADMLKPDTIARAIAGSDAVVNLVGAFKGNLDALHVEGPRRMAQAAAAHGVEALVHISAIGADPVAPSRYGRTKGEGEAAVREAFPAATVLRPSTLFGREDRFVNRFAGMIATATDVPLVHLLPVLRAKAKFQPLFVGDLAAAVTAALGAPDTYAGKTLELGGPDVMTMRGLIDWLAKTIERAPGIVEVPDFAGNLIATFGFLPGAPITRDQWLMLQHDAVAHGDDLRALGVTPTPLAAVTPGWLTRYRRNGRFARAAA
jgi:NADH dehydrogenase